MASLIGGNSILHIANQLSNQMVSKTDVSNNPNSFGETTPNSPTSPSPQYEQTREEGAEKSALTLDMLKDSGLFTCLPVGEVANSDTASSESPEPSTQEHEETNIAQLFNGMEPATQMALLSSLGQQMETNGRDGTPELSEATIRDLMPALAAANSVSCNSTSSPSAWARNAGRKKSHPVWDFFRDLKDTNGAGGVICLHCTWSGDDRSPNNLRTHLKKFHNEDGVFAKFSLKLAQTPTQPYVKRVRGCTGSTSNVSTPSTPSMMMMDQKPMIDSMAFALQHLQQGGSFTDFNTSLNFLDSLPKSSEVINISGGGFIKEEVEDEQEQNHAEAASSSSSEEPVRSDSPDHGHSMTVAPKSPVSKNGSSGDQQNDLEAFIASNNAVLNALMKGRSSPTEQPSSPQPASLKDGKDPSSFSLSDGPCAAILMSMALDLDMTMSYHRRRADIELCFESNRTAEKSGGRGKVICLTDLGKEIRIIERVNGAVLDTELWTKTDFNQFHWAIRGKCQKCFNKP